MPDLEYWTTKEGQRLRISEMDTSHIENCMRMIERKGFIRTRFTGFADYDGVDCDIEEISVRPIYERFNRELLTRGMD